MILETSVWMTKKGECSTNNVLLQPIYIHQGPYFNSSPQDRSLLISQSILGIKFSLKHAAFNLTEDLNTFVLFCLKYFFHFRDAEEDIIQEELPKKLQEKLGFFKDIYSSIVTVDGKKAFSGSTGALSYEIQATPYVKDTWHELPMIDSSTEADKTEVSNWMDWAAKEGFPKFTTKGPSNVVPKDISGGVPKDMLPQGVRVNFANYDKSYENFLAGPMLVKDGEMLIEGSFCQGPNHIRVDVDKNVVKTEAFKVWST